ncbi:MAG: TatD family hydrolase [Candidatus Omnitrophica bacterium]|nr:TatD family hydrolase [Candidatus Omnitrophota bacterium]
MLIDTHCHLDFPEYDQDREEVIKRANLEGVNYLVNVGSSLEGSKRAVALAEKYDLVYASVGLHPHEADGFSPDCLNALKTLSAKKKVVAIGETGLDFFKNFSSRENQEKLFYATLDLAKEVRLPLVIHCRQAQQEILQIFKTRLPLRAVIHCFSGDENFLKECLSLGFFISFTCNITYKKAQDLREMVKLTPLDRLMLETDAPYLSPEGFRGQRNEPSRIKILAQEVAKLRGIGLEELSYATTQNAKKFFNLNPE